MGWMEGWKVSGVSKNMLKIVLKKFSIFSPCIFSEYFESLVELKDKSLRFAVFIHEFYTKLQTLKVISLNLKKKLLKSQLKKDRVE